MVIYGPDNKTPKDQLEELKKLNSSTLFYNKVIIGIAVATFIVSVIGVVITLRR